MVSLSSTLDTMMNNFYIKLYGVLWSISHKNVLAAYKTVKEHSNTQTLNKTLSDLLMFSRF